MLQQHVTFLFVNTLVVISEICQKILYFGSSSSVQLSQILSYKNRNRFAYNLTLT